MRIGIDFDNTLVSYEDLFPKLAKDLGYLPPDFNSGKRQTRDSLRKLPQGEEKWMQVQALAYGSAMGQARLMPGVAEFLLRFAGKSLFIVSHKTRFAAAAPGGCDLHQAALRFISAHDLPIARDNIFFEPTRAAKCRRIASLELDVFIDDLEEVFADPDFPEEVEKILFYPHPGSPPKGNFTAFQDFAAISSSLSSRASSINMMGIPSLIE